MAVLHRFAIYGLLLAVCLGLPAGAGAADRASPAASKTDSAPAPLPPIESAPVVVMSAADCRRLLARYGTGDIAHQPDAGVNYQPGRDVDSQGRPIAPADLAGGNPLPLDKMLTLDVKIPLSTLLGSSRTPPKVGDSELHVTTVTVDPMTGRLSFDGRPLDEVPDDVVVNACRQHLSKTPKP